MGMRTIAPWGLVLLSTAAGCSAEAERTPTPESAAEAKAPQGSEVAAKPAAPSLDPSSLLGTIHFVSERDGNLEVYRWRAASGVQRLTDDPLADFVAEVDAAGRGFTRVATRDGDSPEAHRERLWWMPSEGPAVAIGPEGRRARSPSWAPDRSFVVFESDAEASFCDLWKWTADDGSLTRLTRTEHGAFEPAVSPDGRQIAFVSTQDGNPELYVMDADGQQPARLTTWRRDDMAPRWSPDGARLAFLRREQGGERLLLLELQPDGPPAERRPVPTEPGESLRHADHAWSPDGRRLAFTVHRPREPSQVSVVELDSGRVQVVSPPHLRASMPSWSPDGRFLAVAATESDPAALDLYALSLDGGASARLTSAPASDWLPRWTAERAQP
ncbi:MAG: hypothetical protein AB1Z98_09020 [Nannocystaceae bacterium]